MITIGKITKTYGNVSIFHDFSYSFRNHHLYVLYGPSGCGKTTLFQIMLGLTNIDGGSVSYGQKKYTSQVSFDEVQNLIAYISQESYFIDYLTMQENLELESNKSLDEITKVAKQLKIEKLLKKYPTQISGGERQRFSIAGNLLKEKKIFFLDEPTSSLDYENKTLIYEILNELKKDCLMICATHDDSIFPYADDIIDYEKISTYNKTGKTEPVTFETKRKPKLKNTLYLLKYIWKQTWRTDKKISFLYIGVFLISLLCLFACQDYEPKLFSGLVNQYHTKALRIDCSLDSGDYCQSILEQYNSPEVVYHYIRNYPSKYGGAEFSQEVGSSVVEDLTFQLDILSLPFEQTNFDKIEERLAYGSYFTEPKQVIIGYEIAQKLQEIYQVEMKDLIHRTENLELPDGIDEFEIVGILKPMDRETNTYLTSILGPYPFDEYYYLNGKYLEKYLQDDVYGISEMGSLNATSLTVFFEDEFDFLKFYQDYKDKTLEDSWIRIEDPVNNFAEYSNLMEFIEKICFAFSIIILILALMFYYQIHKTKNIYTDYYYCVFQYYGYQNKEIKYARILYDVTYVLGIMIVASIFAIMIGTIANQVVMLARWIPFSIFTVNVSWLVGMILLATIIATIEGWRLNYIQKKEGWYEMLKEKSDLL